MFSRPLTYLGAPKILDFAHFFFAPALLLLSLFSAPVITREARGLLILTGLLFTAIVFSAIWSNAGLLNIALKFLILAEPLLVLGMLVSCRWTTHQIIFLKKLLLFIVVAHMAISYIEWAFMGHRYDDVRGLFQGMGAGSHVGGAVALSGAIYFFRDEMLRLGKITKTVLLILALGVINMSDSKQVLVVFIASYVAMLLIAVQGIKRKTRYLLAGLAVSVLVWIIPSEFYPGYMRLGNPELLLEGVAQKLSVFNIISGHYNSITDYIFGYGPGHTVGKLAFEIPRYWNILDQFGITRSSITTEVWLANQGHYLSHGTTGSSVFSLNYLWPSLFGDLGLLGLGVYIAILIFIYKALSITVLQKFIVISIFGFGSVFTWVEEPQYIVFSILLIGAMWQECRGAINQAPEDLV